MKSSSMTPDAAHPDKRVPIPKGFSLNDAPYPNDRERANEFPSVFFSPPPPAGPIGALVGFLDYLVDAPVRFLVRLFVRLARRPYRRRM